MLVAVTPLLVESGGLGPDNSCGVGEQGLLPMPEMRTFRLIVFSCASVPRDRKFLHYSNSFFLEVILALHTLSLPPKSFGRNNFALHYLDCDS